MVSGFVTSPCDQLRIFSGEARLMRMASKSAIGLAKSKGLERNKVFLHFLLSKSSGQLSVASCQLILCCAEIESAYLAKLFLKSSRLLCSRLANPIRVLLHARRRAIPIANQGSAANPAQARQSPM